MTTPTETNLHVQDMKVTSCFRLYIYALAIHMVECVYREKEWMGVAGRPRPFCLCFLCGPPRPAHFGVFVSVHWKTCHRAVVFSFPFCQVVAADSSRRLSKSSKFEVVLPLMDE